MKSAVGVIGTGAMGLGVVQSLVRAGIADVPLALAARAPFVAAMAAGYGAEDDAALLRLRLGPKAPGPP